MKQRAWNSKPRSHGILSAASGPLCDLRARVERAVTLISEAPELFPAGVRGTRRFLLERFPFALVYRELPSAIQVLAMAHGRRRPGYWESRVDIGRGTTTQNRDDQRVAFALIEATR